MKGVVLAGGTGSRLDPLTRITNKHLLPIYDRPMVLWALEALVVAGVRELMLVTGGTHAGEFLRLLGNGHEWGIERLFYAYQERPGGIAEALGLAEQFVAGDPVVVTLADNLFEAPITPTVKNFEAQGGGSARPSRGADPSWPSEYLGLAVRGSWMIVKIVEKPAETPTGLPHGARPLRRRVLDGHLPARSRRAAASLRSANAATGTAAARGDGVRLRQTGSWPTPASRSRRRRGQRAGAPEPRRVMDGVELIPLRYSEDERGWFLEVRRDSRVPRHTVQTNVSFSRQGVIRGLHYHERGQDDLFACLTGMARVVVLHRASGERFTATSVRRIRSPCTFRAISRMGSSADGPALRLPRDRGVRSGRPRRARDPLER